VGEGVGERERDRQSVDGWMGGCVGAWVRESERERERRGMQHDEDRHICAVTPSLLLIP
jgi:hypothetical protein